MGRITTQTSMPYPGFEPRPYGTSVSVTIPDGCKDRIEATGSPHTNTIVITAEIESGDFFVAKDDLVPFHCCAVSSCAVPLQTEASLYGHRDPKCLYARCLRMVREGTGAPSEGATCAWMEVDEVVVSTCAFHTMWQSSQRLVCRGCLEPGLRVNGIYRIHWSQHFLTKSERPI
ncbi:uncharacterized protein TNCV_1795981 [Trichonephila clavipes]|nr:uncharacterized protein TNCV_4170161 [Trichonephila clavipes]GFV12111.1 uncharacterized protein TNCV_1795981 [Trichonephila clavipes]